MLIKSYVWAFLALLLAGSGWDVTATEAETQETDLQFEASDGGSQHPPTGP